MQALTRHAVEPRKQFCDRPAKALPGQFGNRFVQRRGLKRQVVRLGAVGLVGRQGLAWFHCEAFLARIYPEREVGHPRQLIAPDVGQVPKSRGGGIEQCTQDSRSYLLKFALELRLVPAHLGLHIEELYDHCAIEKVGPHGTQVGDRIEHHGTGGVEDRLVMIAQHGHERRRSKTLGTWLFGCQGQSMVHPPSSSASTDAICVLGKGIEQTPTKAGMVWRPTRYIEQMSEIGRHTGFRVVGIDPDDNISVVAGSNANVLAATQLCTELYLNGMPPRLVIFPSGRPEYLAAHPDPTLTEAKVLSDRFVRSCRRIGIDRTEIVILGKSRNTREEVRDALGLAAVRGMRAMAIVTVAVHLARAHEFVRIAVEENPALSSVATTLVASEEILQRRYARFRRLSEILKGCATSQAYKRSAQSERAGIDALRHGT